MMKRAAEDTKTPQPTKTLKYNFPGKSWDTSLLEPESEPVSGKPSLILPGKDLTGKDDDFIRDYEFIPEHIKVLYRMKDLNLDCGPSTGIKFWKPYPGWKPLPLRRNPNPPPYDNIFNSPFLDQMLTNFRANYKKIPPKKPIENAPTIESTQERKVKYSKLALDHYNSTTEGPWFELVEVLSWNVISYSGVWVHICFTSKPVHVAADSTDPGTKYFFAELSLPFVGEISIFCCVVDPNLPGTLGVCGPCCRFNKLLHPKDGFQVGNWQPTLQDQFIYNEEGYAYI